MAKITYIEHNGTARTVEVPKGASLMQGAVGNQVPGIDAICGGQCSCATCHVYVDDAWRKRVGPPGPVEAEMLEFVMDPRPESRLACQIKIGDELDGLVVRTPESQQ